MLSVMPAAMQRIVDAGYHPELGARALKRAGAARVDVLALARAVEPAAFVL